MSAEEINLTQTFQARLAAGLVALAVTAALSAQNLTVLNAASFSSGPVTPGSIVTIFGSNLAAGVGVVTDPAHPPVTLAQTTVTIGGTAATLFYVSPSQINAVVAATAPSGQQSVIVASPAGTTTGTVTIDAKGSPGLFSLTGTGTHDGAIIESLTGRVGAFSVNSKTKSTFISLFLTGANLATPATVLVGGVAATVTFAGPSPCCAGLQQINLNLPVSLEGAGRVPVVVTAAGRTSNVVEIVILPAKGKGESKNENENETRSRELAAISSIPGTSLALVADENDDVIRLVDIAGRRVTKTIALPGKSEPVAIAVTSSGDLAVVAERGRAKVALLDLTTFSVKAEVPVGSGPVGVSIAGKLAVVANGDANTITIIDLTTATVVRTVTVGAGPRAVAFDAAGRAYVTNQNAGTISVVDIATGNVVTTLNLGSARPSEIQIVTGSLFALVTDPTAPGPGNVLLVNLTTGTYTTLNTSVEGGGGANALVISGTTAWIASHAVGTVSLIPLTVVAGQVTAGVTISVHVGSGARSLAIDTKDKLLLAVHQGAGVISLVSLTSNEVVGTIKAAVSEDGEEGDDDDHGDHDRAANLPKVAAIAPLTGRAGSSLTLTITGTNLAGATDVVFLRAAALNPRGKGAEDGGEPDTAFSVSGIAVNTLGTTLTAKVSIAVGASTGLRLVRVATPNGKSALSSQTAVFTVLP